MAEIRGSKPLAPIWPVPRGRQVEEDDEAPAGHQGQDERDKNKDEKRGDNGPPHIDEYA